MKYVCLIVQNYYDIDPRVRRKAEALVSAGYDVDVIALQRRGSKERVYTLNGVKVNTLPIEKKRGSFFRYIFEYILFFFLASIKVSLLALKKRYKVIDVNTIPDFLVFAAILPRWLGAEVLLDMHEVMPEFYMSKYGVHRKHWLIKLLNFQEKVSMSFADHVLTINDAIQKLLESRGLPQEKSTIIMNSADESLFIAFNEDAISHDYDKYVLMYHGTLTKVYGLDIALNAFSEVRSRMPNAEFWIVGDGTERSTLETLVQKLNMQKSVKFIGSLPQQEIPKWLKKCDVGVLATRKDVFLDLSFSNKLPEYIIMNKPVIMSRLPAIADYFTEDALAYFEPHDTDDLGEKMFELYNNRSKRKRYVERAKEEYGKINWNVMRKRYLELIDDMTKS